jgi:hypothetical protein
MEMSEVEIALFSFGFIYLVARTLKKSLPHAVLLTAWLLVFLSMFPTLIQGWQIRHIITSIALSFVAMGDLFGRFLEEIRPAKIYPLIRKAIIIFYTAF